MIFLELVPSDKKTVIAESKWALDSFKDIQGINIPDILRLNNRSYDIVQTLANESIPNIPHIRICDFTIENLLKLCEKLLKNNVINMLLISGDPPPNPLQPVYKHNIINVISLIKKHYPKMNIYAGHDPYRQSFKSEFEYSQEKINAGAKGLFTQPIFDIHLAKMIINLNLNCEWFIGISPVLTEKSFNYWVSRNNVVFPSNFELSFDHNVRIGKSIIKLCKENNQNNYIMPIKSDIKKYLTQLLYETTN